MAQVSVRINGYAYMLGCADGQEEHLLALAEDIDQRIDGIKLAAGPSGEARLLLMVALVLSDELYELRGQPEGGQAGSDPAETAAKPDPKTARRLTRLARRAETLADGAEEAASLAQRQPEPPEAGADMAIPEGDAAHPEPAGHGAASPDEENIAAKPGHP